MMEKSFRARWSEALEKYGYTTISNVFISNYALLDITTSEAMFIIHCFKYKWTVKAPYPSFNTLAKDMGNNRNTVQRYARSLEKKGYLKRVYSNGTPSKININPLIEVLERIAPYNKLDRGSIKNMIKPYQNLDTKEEASRIKIKEGVIKSI